VKFRAGDLEFNATVAESSQTTSPRAMTIQFRAQKTTMHAQAVEAAEQRRSGGLFSVDEGLPESEWRVRESTFSYVGTEPWGINHHVWRIEEVERLACERLMLGSLSLEPYEYLEKVSDTGIVRLAARAATSQSQLDALSRLSGPIEVTRVGISNTPRRMLLDGYVWGPSPSGLAAALACEDVHEPRVTLDATHTPPDDALDDLLTVLRAKNLLDEENLADLRERIRQRRHAAHRVEDVNAWSL